jgi:hypothetical protein
MSDGPLSRAEVQARMTVARASFDPADESAAHWLSFCDPDKPAGSQFLGVAIVRAGALFIHAPMKARFLGINPGGEVRGYVVDERGAAAIPPRYWNRLLTRDEITTLETIVSAALGGETT